MADTLPPQVFATEPAEAFVEAGHGGAPTHVEPSLLGLAPFQWVSVAMLLLLLIAVFYAKAHKTIAGGLDGKIQAIKDQLDEAKQLRAEAEALREEYAGKIKSAEADAEAMLATARHEADMILEKADADSRDMVARRQRMAEDKIAAAEREALHAVREKAARAATRASRTLIVENFGAEADRAMADRVIADI